MPGERGSGIVRCSRWLVLLVPPLDLLSRVRLPPERWLWSSGRHLLHVLLLVHRMLPTSVSAGQASVPELSFAEVPLPLLQFAFAHHLQLSLLTLPLGHVSRILVLDRPNRTVGIVLVLPTNEVVALHRRSAHVHRPRRWDTRKGLWLAVWSRYWVSRHSSLFSDLFGRRMRQISLRVGLRRSVTLDFGCPVRAVR